MLETITAVAALLASACTIAEFALGAHDRLHRRRQKRKRTARRETDKK